MPSLDMPRLCQNYLRRFYFPTLLSTVHSHLHFHLPPSSDATPLWYHVQINKIIQAKTYFTQIILLLSFMLPQETTARTTTAEVGIQ